MEKQNLPMSVSAEKDALSEEQRARISLRFRAAKALLARKKPRVSGPLFSPSPSEKDAPSVAGAAEPVFSMDRNHRIPLGNIDSNRDSPFIFRAPRCSIVGLNKVMSLEGSPMGRFDENAKRVGSLLEGESFHTPVRPIIKESRCSNIGSFHTPSVTGAAEPVFSVDRNHRISIGNINSNRDSPFIFRAPRCSNVGLNKVMSSEGSPMGRFVKNGKHVGSLLEGESFHTPAHPIIKESECSSMLQHSLFPSLPDEDFDDGILQQIDIVCKEKTAEKVQGKINSSSMQVGSFYKSDEDLKNHECVLLDTTCSKSNNLQMILNKSGEDLEKHDCMLPNTPGSESNNEQMILNKDIKDMPEEYTKYVGSLNDQQQEAACSDISVPLMVVAGPGSGKTSTMVGRVLMLLSKGIGPSHILAMTFTTAAASEMRDRVSGVTGKEIAKELNISTFHSFSLQFCRSHAEKLGYTSDFLIYGHGQQRRAVIEALRLLEMEQNNKTSDDAFSPQILKDKSKKWQKFVTQAKASGVTPEDFHLKGDEIGATLLKHYNDTLRTCNALDYHDLINYSVKLLNDHPKVLEECHQSWKAVIVDEFQDTSAMQYRLLRFLASHGCLTVVGDEDQSIFSFNGADISGFDSFRKDFPRNKEIRLKRNYRSTRCIVEAASALIRHNKNRCQFKNALTENASGDKISVKECQTEDAQCSFVIDKILEYTSEHSATKLSFNKIAILYRRQVSGKVFQTAFRSRRIPFNEHGVAFYRKKVIKAIMSMLKTALSGCDDASFRQVFKALLPFEKEEKNKVIEHINKVATVQNCSFISAAREIFSAKISGTFKRSQLSQGRKVLATLEMISKLVQREESISAVITSVGNLLPQRYLLEKRAVVDAEDGKLLNEDNDLRSVLQYLLDDVNDFLSTKFLPREIEKDDLMPKKGCTHVLKAFIDYISERERENFRSRRHDNDNSVTLTTIHQSKGLEWDIVFIVKVNESEIPLLHEHNGNAKEKGNSLEEERRLLYVAMTRARKKLFLLYLIMDSNWQMLQPSRFLREIPDQLYEMQERITYVRAPGVIKNEVMHVQSKCHGDKLMENFPFDGQMVEVHKVIEDEGHEAQLIEDEAPNGNCFLQRFDSEDRGIVSRLFHQWARKKAFQDPKRLIDKVRFVVDERLRQKQNKSKDALHALKSCLGTDEAIQFAGYVLRCEQIDPDTRAHIMREKQQHFQKLRMETVMNSSEPTSKQIAYLRNLGCTIVPDSRLHASHLIEQYKSL